MNALYPLRDASGSVPVVAIIGGAVAGSEAAAICAKHGAIALVFEQGPRPYGKIEDGLPRWHVKLREKEYQRIDENLDRERIFFVPQTALGRELSLEQLQQELKLSAVVLANGAWRDRPLPLDDIEPYVGRGLVYQNPFVYWFNHANDPGYAGPVYEVEDRAIVVGGGLASIDVVKIINLELYQQALKARGIQSDIVELELKGIPKVLEEHGLSQAELGVHGCTLYYRRRKEDMPLASGDTSDPDKLAKLQKARIKIMDRVMRKYLVRFEPLMRPATPLIKDDRLVGLRFQRTRIEAGRVIDVPGEEQEIESKMIISSIGSVPKAIPGIPLKGELYDYSNWDTGELRDLPGVFGLGNVLTGKGNIRDSRKNAIEISEGVVCAYLGIADVSAPPAQVDLSNTAQSEATVQAALQGGALNAEQQAHVATYLEKRWQELGYVGYRSWIEEHPAS